jgi:chorismate mutase/prephenate dehydratase
MRVAFQGEKGAYSENAVHAFFSRTVATEPCRNLSDVFEKVEKGETEFGVVPVENSTEGSVNETYDLFLTHSPKVCGEKILKIDHCLVANPSTKLASIKTIYSHPQALAQCRRFLERLNYEPIPVYDTAGSVKMMKEKRLKDAGAIASEGAAKLYGMKILARGIADSPNNYTRFFVLSKNDSPPTGRDKTSIIFSVRHTPGSLYRALGVLARKDINMTKLESRPTRQTPWEYNFYLDFEGHRTEERCREALTELEEKALFLRILGSYPRDPEGILH